MRERTKLKLKRVEFTIRETEEPLLAFLMKRCSQNRSNTLRLLIGNAYNRAKGTGDQFMLP